jgi:hypothetical protein
LKRASAAPTLPRQTGQQHGSTDGKRGRITEYLLPRSTNIRRVYVDSATTPPTFWTGSNHGASIVKMEPLD